MKRQISKVQWGRCTDGCRVDAHDEMYCPHCGSWQGGGRTASMLFDFFMQEHPNWIGTCNASGLCSFTCLNCGKRFKVRMFIHLSYQVLKEGRSDEEN